MRSQIKSRLEFEFTNYQRWYISIITLMSTKKSLFENLCLVDAALYINESVKETTLKDLGNRIEGAYREKLAHWISRGHTLLHDISAADQTRLGGDMDGIKLWRKWQRLKRELLNSVIPEWAHLSNDPPTGTSLEELLLGLRKVLWRMDLLEKEKPAIPLKDDWYPASWAAFIEFGPPAGKNASPILNAELSNGPKKQASPISNAEQRAVIDQDPGQPESRARMSRQEMRDNEKGSKKRRVEEPSAHEAQLLKSFEKSNHIDLYNVNIVFPVISHKPL